MKKLLALITLAVLISSCAHHGGGCGKECKEKGKPCAMESKDSKGDVKEKECEDCKKTK